MRMRCPRKEHLRVQRQTRSAQFLLLRSVNKKEEALDVVNRFTRARRLDLAFSRAHGLNRPDNPRQPDGCATGMLCAPRTSFSCGVRAAILLTEATVPTTLPPCRGFIHRCSASCLC